MEEARAALAAYWRLCERRMHEDVSTAADVLLLQRCGERLESDLLAAMQLWMADNRQMDRLFDEESVIKDERKAAAQRKADLDAALVQLDRLLATLQQQ